MIPDGFESKVIQTGIGFMKVITEAYGYEEGMKLWDTIASTLDPDVKGKIFFALLTGNYSGEIVINGLTHGVAYTADKISAIKAIRNVTGLGLKESKDTADLLFSGCNAQIQVKEGFNTIEARKILQRANLEVL